MLYSKLLFIFGFVVAFVSIKNRTNAARLKLIHPSKVLTPPYYDPNDTFFEQVKMAKESSISRYAYLKTKNNIQNSSTDDVIQPGLTADIFGFYVNFSIGDPPISQMVVMDSGSELLWVQCLPCTHCFPQQNTFYDPSKSSSYSMVKKFTPDCKISQGAATRGDTCIYTLKYADNTSTEGDIGKEKLTFTTSDEGIIAIPNLLFGCGHENYGSGLRNGILGLDAHPISLVSQLGSKFSYCKGNINDPNYEYNHLVIGEGAVFIENITQFEIKRGLYYLTLESIYFGQKKLDVDPSVFKLSPEGKGGVIIDSGTFLTFLARSAFTALIEQVENWNFGRLPKVTLGHWDLCYKGVMSRDLHDDFPVISVQFSGGLIEVNYDAIFHQVSSDIFCIAVTPVDDYELNIIGINFQQYSNVGYDIPNKTLYFAAMDCRLLDS